MDLLITLIGNAAVDPVFRKKLLANPVDVSDHYGFHFTKSDFELMKIMFDRLSNPEKDQFEKAFLALEELLYKKIPSKIGCQTRPCFMSISPPAELRADWPKVA